MLLSPEGYALLRTFDKEISSEEIQTKHQLNRASRLRSLEQVGIAESTGNFCQAESTSPTRVDECSPKFVQGALASYIQLPCSPPSYTRGEYHCP